MRRLCTAVSFFYVMVYGVPSQAQPIESYGSGLEVHLMIDCSRTMWPSNDPSKSEYFRRILEMVLNRLRPVQERGDSLSVYLFSDRAVNITPLHPIVDVGHEVAHVLKYLDDYISKRESGSPLATLNTEVTDFAASLDGVRHSFHSQDASGLGSNRMVLMITDGINDPRNEMKGKPEDYALEQTELTGMKDVSRAIQGIRDLGGDAKICMIQFPFRLGDQYAYAHMDSWKSLLDVHQAAATFTDLAQIISDAFRLMRMFPQKTIWVETAGLQIDKWGYITGRLTFVPVEYLPQPLEVTIELDAIFDKRKKRVPISRGLSFRGEKLSLIFFTTLVQNKPTEVAVRFKLPMPVATNTIGYVHLDFDPRFIQTRIGRLDISYSINPKDKHDKDITRR